MKSILTINRITLEKYTTLNKYFNSTYIPEDLADKMTKDLKWNNDRPFANNIAKVIDYEDVAKLNPQDKMPSPILIGEDMLIGGWNAKKGDKFYRIGLCSTNQLNNRKQEVADWYQKRNITPPGQTKPNSRLKKRFEPEDPGDVPINLPSETSNKDMFSDTSMIDPKDIPF